MPAHGERRFLRDRGLARSAATTRLVHSQDGVNCLGLHLRTCGTQGTWLPVPQQEKVLTHLRARRSSWDAPTQPPAGHVMKALHPVIRGWAPSSRHGAAQPVCQKARHAQWQLLWAWAKRRPPHQSSQWVKARDCRSARLLDMLGRAGSVGPARRHPDDPLHQGQRQTFSL